MPGWTSLSKAMGISETQMIAWLIFGIISSLVTSWVIAHFFVKM